MNRRTAVIDATGYRTETRYSLRGDVTAVTNANDETVKFEIDALGRKTAAIDPMGFRREFQYDEAGNLVCTIDANAQAGLQPKNAQTPACSETRQYDELNRVTKIIDADNGETVFTYDRLGNRLTVKDAELKTWSFAYDDLGRLASETDHSAKTTSYKPDEAGNVYEKTNRLNEVTRFSFDNGNRLTRVDYLKDGSAETFGYDPAGNPNAAANASVAYGFQYDRLNRLTQKTDGRGKNLAFTFDKVGNILTKTTYQGSTTSYVYNAANRLVMLRNPDYTQVDYQYDPAGRLLSKVTANGARMTQQYDANGWQTRLTQYDAANVLISDATYTRDRLGNILTTVDAAGTTTYAYDPLYRLKTADYPGTANDELFTYDKAGNRKTATKGSLTANANTRYYNYTAGTNRLLDIRIGSTTGTVESTLIHDFEGRLTGQTGVGAKTLTWDAKGRVKTVGAETYNYDPMDYRIKRSGGSLGSLDYFLEGEHLESVYSGANLYAKYFRGSTTDELVAGYLYDTDSKLKPFLFHHDNVNSVSQVSGHNGGTLQSTTFSAFGSTQTTTGASPNRLKYTGREDDNTGLYYYRARYYDPAIGRFVSEDPLGFEAGDVNFYAYVGNNPVNANDPSGMVEPKLIPFVSQAKLAWDWVSAKYDRAIQIGNQLRDIQAPAVALSITGGDRSAANTLLHNGQVDAWRHAEWNRQMVVDPQVGPTFAAIAGYGHEVVNLKDKIIGNGIPGQTWTQFTQESLMDLSNNSFGRAQGSAGIPNININDPGLVYGVGGTQGQPDINFSDYLFNSNSFLDYGAAGGGFLLYPNKANTNMMRSVYSK